MSSTIIRCEWAKHPLDQVYHDQEWGRPTYGDQAMFEYLTLEGAQAGLSWTTILKKREGYRQAFLNWDINAIARFNEKDIERLMQDAGIVRNRLKITSTVNNAKASLELQKEQTLTDYFWGWVNHEPIINRFKTMAELPAQTDLSKLISKDLKKRGFRFVGPTIMYAFMQATGMVCDHTIDCFCHPDNQ